MIKKYCQRCKKMKDFSKYDYVYCDSCFMEINDDDEELEEI